MKPKQTSGGLAAACMSLRSSLSGSREEFFADRPVFLLQRIARKIAKYIIEYRDRDVHSSFSRDERVESSCFTHKKNERHDDAKGNEWEAKQGGEGYSNIFS